MLAPPALRFTYPLAAPRVRETGIAKPGQRLWTFTPNGKAFTSITPASCNAPRSIRWRKARPGAHSGRAAVDVAALPECAPGLAFRQRIDLGALQLAGVIDVNALPFGVKVQSRCPGFAMPVSRTLGAAKG